MSGLAEQIAVLDGLGALDPNDGRIGQQRARVAQYAKQIMPNVLRKKNMISYSGGALYGGGSSYTARMPLMPSTIGLAGMGNIPSVLPTKRHVIDYSGGANYSGGSDWAPGMPLLPSSAGLADALIQGGYGRAGLGAALIQGGYGRAGLGQTGTAVDEDLAAAAEAVEVARRMDPNDGRIGQRRAAVDEYGRPIMPGVLARSNVIDPSEGANYSGGSNYAQRMPLMPSTIGLAGLGDATTAARKDAIRAGLRSGQNMTASQAVAKAKLAVARLEKELKTDIPTVQMLVRTGKDKTASGRAIVERVNMKITLLKMLKAIIAKNETVSPWA